MRENRDWTVKYPLFFSTIPSESRYHLGSKLLPKVLKARERKKRSPGQMSLPWDDWEATDEEIREVAEKFVMANCYDPGIASQFFNDS